MRRPALAAPLALALAFFAAPAAAAGVNVGELTCEQVPGTRSTLLVHSSAEVACVFRTSAGAEHYKGETGIGFGLDVAFKSESLLAFSVIAAGGDVAVGNYALAGKYVGTGGSFQLGPGVGWSVLVGKGENGVSLEPLSFETSVGLGLTVGGMYLFLEPDPASDPPSRTP